MKTLLQGNRAIALGAMKAGLKFYAGYPITPASEVLHYLVRQNVKTVQMEDEIASINAVIGASMAGAKAMTATSGPGFSLMQEAVGYAHMTETPCLIVNVQRAGPSTGMPTLFSQGRSLPQKQPYSIWYASSVLGMQCFRSLLSDFCITRRQYCCRRYALGPTTWPCNETDSRSAPLRFQRR